MSNSQSNVIFIVCDDLNDAIAGMGGHPQAKTPNLERLIKRGKRFTNAQTNVPICGPSRASFLTGVAPWTSGYCGYTMGREKWYENPLLKDCKTFMEHFSANNYRVFGTGKIFHNGEEKNEVWKDGLGHMVDWGPWSWNGLKEGFGWKASCGHQNFPEKWGPELIFGSLSDVPDIPPNAKTGAPGYRGWRKGDNSEFRYVNNNDRDRMPDELNAEWAADVLSQQQNDPFLLCVGIGKPHTPLFAPKEFFDLFPLEEIELAVSLEGDAQDCAQIIQNGGTSDRSWGRRKYNMVMEEGGEEMLRRWTQAYLACVAFADAQIGTVLDALEESPYNDNTLIVFTSDNGYQMGEKEWLFKYSPWEEANRVPFVVAGPSIPQNSECETAVSLLDLYPTLIDYCQLSPNPNKDTNNQPLEGMSLVPLLKGKSTEEWGGPMAAISLVSDKTDRRSSEKNNIETEHISVRSRTHRYILYTNGEEELYDHTIDPYEWHNKASDPDFVDVKNQLREFLFKTIHKDR